MTDLDKKETAKVPVIRRGIDLRQFSSDEEEKKEKDDLPRAIDIAQLLQAQFVFFSGGKDKNGSAVVTFPPVCTTLNLRDQEIQEVLRYLIFIANRHLGCKNGYCAIVDRRNNKWTNVKLVLSWLQKLFTAYITSVYILKPQGFFQRYVESSFKNLQYSYKFKVVLLNNPAELLEYFEQDQLSLEFGGNLCYDHSDWVQHRTAIERFSDTVKTVSLRLEGLQQCFENMNFTSSIEEMNKILETHLQLWGDIKEDISSAQLAGNTLLGCIQGPVDEDGNTVLDFSHKPDVKANIIELIKLLDRLNGMNSAFQFVWNDHEKRLHQCVELCGFEQEFGRVSGSLISATSKLNTRNDIGESVSNVETLIEELKTFKEINKSVFEDAKTLQEKGAEFIQKGHYAEESIKLRCSELQQMVTEYEKRHVSRMEELTQSKDVHICLEQIHGWCNSGVDLLAAQPVDSFQSTDRAEKALHDIDAFVKDARGVNLRKLNQMEHIAKNLGNEALLGKVKTSLARMTEVKNMINKRENSLKRLVVKRPVQPVPPVSPNSQESRKRSSSSYDIKSQDNNNSRRKSSSADKKSPGSPSSRKISIIIQEPKGTASIRSPRTPSSTSHSSFSSDSSGDHDESIDIYKKRNLVMYELIETERDYVNDLKCVIEGYLREYENAGDRIPEQLHGKKAVIFGNIEEIYEFHKSSFLKELDICQNQPLLVGQIFINKKDEFQMYATYCKNKPNSEALRRECADVPFFKECQKKLGHQLPLHSYLLKPVQRITKYQLLLKEMMKYSVKSQVAYDDLQEALDTMKRVLRHVNDVMHSTGLTGFHGNLSDQGRLVFQDAFHVWHTTKKTLNLPNKAKTRQVFLYEKIIIFTKKDEDNTKDYVTYHYKSNLQMRTVGITESIKGTPTRFELWTEGRQDVYLLQAESVDIKETWVREIRNLLLSQFDQVKEKVSINLVRRKSLYAKIQDSFRWNSTSNLVPSSESKLEKNSSLGSPSLPRVRSSSINSIPSVVEVNLARMQSRTPHIERHWSQEEEQMPYSRRAPPLQDKVEEVEEEDFEDDGYDDDEWSDDDTLTDAPEPPTGMELHQIALAAYDAQETSEMSLKQGENVQIIRLGTGGWWYAKSLASVKEGWVPASYLEPLSNMALYYQDKT